jgi:hypothetical protein
MHAVLQATCPPSDTLMVDEKVSEAVGAQPSRERIDAGVVFA